mgnify:CR=1 FL=1
MPVSETAVRVAVALGVREPGVWEPSVSVSDLLRSGMDLSLLDDGRGQRVVLDVGGTSGAQAPVDVVDQMGQRNGQGQIEQPGGDQGRQVPRLRVEVAADLEALAGLALGTLLFVAGRRYAQWTPQKGPA